MEKFVLLFYDGKFSSILDNTDPKPTVFGSREFVLLPYTRFSFHSNDCFQVSVLQYLWMSLAPWELTSVSVLHTDWADRQSGRHLPKHVLGRWDLQWVRHTDRAGTHCTLLRPSRSREHGLNSSVSDYFVWVWAKLIKSYIIDSSQEHSEVASCQR